MDPPITYPSLASNPASQPQRQPDPSSLLRYPDPSIEEQIDPQDISHAQASDASETVLINIPDAIAHLIDRDSSVHLASGPFTVARLCQDKSTIAVFARIGKELQWPLTIDQASVKIDSFHYFFSLVVPPEVEQQCRSSAEEINQASGANERLNYGVTFSANTDPSSLIQLDELLKQYSFFSVEGVPYKDATDSSIKVLADQLAARGKEEGSAEYWTVLAPNVEDYSDSISRGIAAGAGQVIRGIFWCSQATVSQIEKANAYFQGKIKPTDSPTKMSPAAMRRIRRVRKISAMSEKVASGVLSGVLRAANFVTKPFVTSKAGKKLLSLLPGQIALASLEAFGKVFDALEIAGKNVLTTTSTATTGLVAQKYGDEAADFTQQGLHAAGGFLTTAWAVSKIRKAFYPSSVVKNAVKTAAAEHKSSSSKNNKIAEK